MKLFRKAPDMNDFAQEGEVFLTQFIVKPDSTSGMSTKEEAEGTMRGKYPNHELRFHYGDLVYGNEWVSSQEYASRSLVGSRPIVASSFGGAVFGTPINE